MYCLQVPINSSQSLCSTCLSDHVINFTAGKRQPHLFLRHRQHNNYHSHSCISVSYQLIANCKSPMTMENASHLPGSLHSTGAELWGCHGLSTTKQTPPSNTTHGTHAWGSLGPSSSFLHQCAVRNHLNSRTVTLSLVMTSLFAFYWLHQAYIEKIKINTCYLKWCNEWVINIYKILCKNIYKKK